MTASYLTQLLFGQWLPRLGNVLLQSVFVLCIAFGILELLRRASAAARHLVAVTAQAILLILPFAAFVLPGRALSPVRQAGMASVRQPGLQFIRSNALSRHDGTVGRTQIGGIGADRLPVQASTQIAADASGVSARGRDMRNTAVTPAVPAAPPSRIAVGMAWAAWTVWLAGALGMLARCGLGMWRLHGMARSCHTVSDTSLMARLNDLQAEAGLKRPVKIVQFAAPDSRFSPSVAMTWGAWRPVLLLPTDASGWSGERLRAVVLHELAHVRRNDWLTQTLGQIVCAVYWFHPLVWRLHGRAQMEAEHACDDAVLRGGMRGSDYAAHLLDAARAVQAGRAPLAGAVSMARTSQVQPRVEAVLCSGCRRGEVRRSALMGVFMVAGLVLLAASRLHPLAQKSPPDRTPASGRAAARAALRRSIAAQIAATPGLPAYRHTYACGLTMELAAIYENARHGQQWWWPDGSPLPDTLKVAYLDLPTGGWAGLFRVSGTFTGDYSFAGQVTPATHEDHIVRMDVAAQSLEIYPLSICKAFSLGTRECAVRWGVAAGTWQTAGVVRMPVFVQRTNHILPSMEYGDITLRLSSVASLTYKDATGRSRNIPFPLHSKVSDNVACRFVAIDSNNAVTPIQNTGTSNGVEYIGLNFRDHDPNSRIDLDHIREFRLQTRPYEWAEFRNVQLQPTGGR